VINTIKHFVIHWTLADTATNCGIAASLPQGATGANNRPRAMDGDTIIMVILVTRATPYFEAILSDVAVDVQTGDVNCQRLQKENALQRCVDS
jgi:hypothetical protein